MTKKEYYGKIEMLQVTPQICDVFLKSREQFMEPILKHYGVSLSDLRIELRKEYCIPQFTVREMDLALHFLIENCQDRQDECAETLHEEVTKCILYSGIYFTNILPGIESGEGVAGVITPEKATEIKCDRQESEKGSYTQGIHSYESSAIPSHMPVVTIEQNESVQTEPDSKDPIF